MPHDLRRALDERERLDEAVGDRQSAIRLARAV
jgi:hypothetical protein